jgi:hypothetical protein
VSASVAAAMETAASTMESVTVEITRAFVKPLATVKATITAPESTAVEATVLEAFASPKTAVVIEIPPVVAAPVVAAPIITASVEAMKPRAGAYKHATDKVVWTVVAIRRTSIRVISVVAVGANRSGTVVGRTDSNADNYSLRVGWKCCREHTNSKQC